jgi:CheY-like chemotaxis protein
MTGYGTERDRRASREAGIDEHMLKPVDLGMLQRLLARLPDAAR